MVDISLSFLKFSSVDIVSIYVDNVSETVKELTAKGFKTYAAHLKGQKNYDMFDYTGPTAFLIGNEGNGLSKETADAAGEYVLIPMKGEVESMNAATSHVPHA